MVLKYIRNRFLRGAVALNFEIQEADVEMKELQKEIRESTISSGEERTNYCTVNG